MIVRAHFELEIILQPSSSGRSAPIHLVTACVVLAGFILAGCSKPPPTPAQLPKSTVKVAVPVNEEFQDFEEFTGRAEGSQFVEIRSRVSGYLDTILFKPGSYIEKDAELFVIDSRQYDAALDQAEASVTQAETREERLAMDLKRAKELVEKKIMAAQDFDKILGDKIESDAVVRAAKATRKQAELNVEFTKIHAPITGLVSRERITTGNLVQADQTILTTIAAYDPIFLYFDMDENTVLRILSMIRAGTFKSVRENQVPVQGAVGDSKGFPFEGMMNFVDNRIDPATGTMNMRGEFKNPKTPEGAPFITPGMFIRVRVPMGAPHKALQISRRAVITDQGHKLVYVVNAEQKVEARTVTLGKPTDDGLQIVESGLTESDRIVVAGLQRVRPGLEVDINEVPMRDAAK